MKKKVICTFLCFVMCLSLLVVPVSATETRDTSFEESLALNLKALGLFRGTGAGFELNRPATRVEAVVMLIRVLGKEDEALAGKWGHPFTDVASWADQCIGYAFENGLANGSGPTTFGNGNVTAAMYLTLVLRALGYSDTNGADFTWDNPYALAKTVGILNEKVDINTFLRADLAAISYYALNAYLKDGSQTLAEKLIDAGTFTKAQYDAYYDYSIYDQAGDASAKFSLNYYVDWIDADYYACNPFVNGFSRVWNNGAKASYYALVNSQGEEVWPLSEQNHRVGNFQDGLAYIYVNTSSGEKQFFIDQKGKIAIDPEKLGYCYAEPFSDGLARVRKGQSLWQETNICYIDTDGREIINLNKEYYATSDFSEGYAFIQNRECTKIINKTGKVTAVLPSNFGFTNLVSAFHEGYAVIFDQYDENGQLKNGKNKYYFTDPYGNLLNETGYESATSFSEGLAQVKMDGKYGYIDTSGNVVIPFVWDSCTPFNNGVAFIKVDGKLGLIDKAGNLLAEPKYKYRQEFADGYCAVSDMSGELWGIINNEGKEVIPLVYQSGTNYAEGLVLARKNNSYGYLNVYGEVVIPFQFEMATTVSDGIAWVKQDGKWGILHVDTSHLL